MAERVAGVMDELQKRRSAMQTESDISEVLAGLRVNAPPPAPAPEPEAPAAETGAAAASDAAAAEAAAGPQAPVVLRLQGIAWSDRAPLAIVNKRTVGVGELVEGFRVERITRNSTVLTGPDGESRELRLYEPVPATP